MEQKDQPVNAENQISEINRQEPQIPQKQIRDSSEKPHKLKTYRESHKITIFLVIAFILLLSGVIGFFLFQNYRTNNMPEIATSPSPEPSTTSTPSSTSDPIPSTTPIPKTSATPISSPEETILPDIKVTSGTIRGNSSIPGTTFEEGSINYIEFVVTVENTQPVSTSEVVYLKAWVDNKEIKNTYLGHWPPNYKRTDIIRADGYKPGTHTIKVEYNPNHSFSEVNYDNNSIEATYTILPDDQPPTFKIDGPIYQSSTNETCMRYIDASDNVSVYTDLKMYTKLDENSWDLFSQYQCISGTPGESHTFYVKAVDLRGNTTEKSQQFSIL